MTAGMHTGGHRYIKGNVCQVGRLLELPDEFENILFLGELW
jgi:hypothetical protein